MNDSRVGFVGHETPHDWMPVHRIRLLVILFGTIVLVLAPALLGMFGVSFSAITGQVVDGSGEYTDTAETLDPDVSSNLVHTILEWSAFCVAIFTAVAAWVIGVIKRDKLIVVVGAALFCAGCLDAFHILATDRLLSVTLPTREFQPFTWLLCRTFHAAILTVGATFMLASRPRILRRWWLVGLAVSVLLMCVAIYYSATTKSLPITLSPDFQISRPWDLVPLLFYVVLGGLICPLLYAKKKSWLILALWISIIPHVASQLNMALGSSMPYDNYFNIAHALKVVAYAVPLVGLAFDNIETHRREQLFRRSLLLSEQRLERAVLGSSDGFWDWDCQTDEVFYSTRFRELLGYHDEEDFPNVFESFRSHLHEDDVDAVFAAIEQHREHHVPYDVEYRLRTHKGTYRWFRARGQALWDEQNRTRLMSGSIQDITEKKIAELALLSLANTFSSLSEEELFNRVCEQLSESLDPDFVLVGELVGDLSALHILSARDRKSRIDLAKFDLTEAPSELLRSDCWCCDEGLSQEFLENSFLAENEIQGCAGATLKSVSGKTLGLILAFWKTPLPDEAAARVLLEVFRDRLARAIERNRAEEARRELQLMLQGILDNTTAVIYIKGLDGSYKLVNKRYLELFELSTDELYGYTDFEIFEREFAEKFRKNDELVVERETAIQIEETAPQVDGVHYYITTKFPLYDGRGRLNAVAGISTDITESRLAKEELESRTRELEASNTELEQFVYAASHDLKSPLLAMLGYSGFLLDDAKKGLYEDIPRYAERILRNAERMRAVIDDLLEISQIGQHANRTENVSCARLLAEALELTEPEKGDQKIEIKSEFEVEEIYADPARLRQVLQNLIVNAIRYGCTEDCSTIEVGTVARGEATNLYVRDHGPGIDPEYHEKVFGLFQRLSGDKKSTGVGLAIVRRVAEVHGGHAWVESSLGAGATFWISFPQSKFVQAMRDASATES